MQWFAIEMAKKIGVLVPRCDAKCYPESGISIVVSLCGIPIQLLGIKDGPFKYGRFQLAAYDDVRATRRQQGYTATCRGHYTHSPA